MKFSIVFFLFTAGLMAQVAPDPPPAPSATYPSYFVSAGGGYNRNAVPQAAEGWVAAAIGLGGGNFSITTVDMTAATSTVRTGFARVMSKSGNFSLLARIDAGIATVTPVIGSFSGGAIVIYDLGGLSAKTKGLFVLGEVRISGTTSVTAANPNQVTPGFYFGLGKSF